MEEAIIAWAHLIITIVKLKPSGANVSAFYSRIQRHIVVLFPKPELLLNLLSLSNHNLHEIICIIWLKKHLYNKNGLWYFGWIRKAKVLEALLWLKDNITLYKDIVINLNFIDTWQEEFVLANGLSRVLEYDEDIQEREGYITDLEVGNFENNLYHAANNIRIGNSGLLSGCLYIDVNNTREHPTIKLVLAITSHKNRSYNDNTNSPIWIYENNESVTPLNNWNNPKYFRISFRTFFSFWYWGSFI